MKSLPLPLTQRPLIDILGENGEEELYRPVRKLADLADKEPPLIFGWNGIDAFVNAIQSIPDEDSMEVSSPLSLPEPLTPQGFKRALLEYIRQKSGADPPLGSSVLPCRLDQMMYSVLALVSFENHPWTQYILAHRDRQDKKPLATVYIPHPRTDQVVPACCSGFWAQYV